MALKPKIKMGKLAAISKTTGEIIKYVKTPKCPIAMNPDYQTAIEGESDLDDIYVNWKNTGGSDPLHTSNFKLRIVECPEDKLEEELQWVKVKIDKEAYLICDRPLMNNGFGSWYGMNPSDDYPYLGPPFKFRGVEYTPAVLTDLEWGTVMYNLDNIPGLPIPTAMDIKNSGYYTPVEENKAKYEGEHNRYWNWFGTYTAMARRIEGTSKQVFKGFRTPVYSETFDLSSNNRLACLRPVYRITPHAAVISGNNIDLGEKVLPFQYSYSIDLNYADDPAKVEVLLDTDVIDTYNITEPISDKAVNLADRWEAMGYGPHKITIRVTDEEFESARVVTFKKSADRPGLLPEAPSIGEVSETIDQLSDYTGYLTMEVAGKFQEVIKSLK